MTKIITSYEPDNSLKNGYKSIFGEIYHELKNNTWLTYQIFRRDFRALYTQSFIGIAWAIIVPLVSVGTFVVLNRAGIFNAGNLAVPYALFAVIGIALWQLFATGLITSSNSLVNAGPMILKINFCRKSLIIASTGQSLVAFAIQFCLVLALFVFFKYIPSPLIVLIPVLILPLFLLTLGLGFIFSLVNGILRDVSNVLSVLVTFLLFLTPVLYEAPTNGFLAFISKYNPLYYLIAVPRDLILTGTTTELRGFLIASALSLIFFIVCLVAFHLTETRVTERI